MTIGLLGLQSAFQDHIPHLEELGVSWRVVRDTAALKGIDRLIIPGGESTVMGKYLVRFGMDGHLRSLIHDGMPVWGICAGAILLADRVDGRPGLLKGFRAAVRRNAYGRQAESDCIDISVPILEQTFFPAVFIRAPKMTDLGPVVIVHARWNGDPVFLQQGHRMATTFHPELTPHSIFHRYFIDL